MAKRQKDMCPFSYSGYSCRFIQAVKEKASIGEQEREIQNPQVLSISSKSSD